MFSRRMLSAAVASSAFLLLLPVAPSACLPLRRMLTVELLLVGRLLFRLLQALLQALLFLLLLQLLLLFCKHGWVQPMKDGLLHFIRPSILRTVLSHVMLSLLGRVL